MSEKLKNLPKTMMDRAIFARQRSKEHPELIEVDNEMLPWIYCEDDNLWYSFDGNYSTSSPQEKAQKQLDHELKQLEYETNAVKNAMQRYEDNLYWSKIRQDILERDKHTCQICDKKASTKLHIHHICKIKEQGTEHYDNLITVCPQCHPKIDRNLYNPEWE